jgi:hypothetical protein
MLAIAEAVRRFNLQPDEFHDMLAGQWGDLDAARFDTWEELRDFCYRVAGTVGIVCIRVWGFHDPEALKLAVDRGIAFQLTNVLRDLRDAGLGSLPGGGAEVFAPSGGDAAPFAAFLSGATHVLLLAPPAQPFPPALRVFLGGLPCALNWLAGNGTVASVTTPPLEAPAPSARMVIDALGSKSAARPAYRPSGAAPALSPVTSTCVASGKASAMCCSAAFASTLPRCSMTTPLP